MVLKSLYESEWVSLESARLPLMIPCYFPKQILHPVRNTTILYVNKRIDARFANPSERDPKWQIRNTIPTT